MGINSLFNEVIQEYALDEIVRPQPVLHKHNTSRPVITGGDWLTNVDGPAGLEEIRRLDDLFNCRQELASLSSIVPSAPSPPTMRPQSGSHSASSTSLASTLPGPETTSALALPYLAESNTRSIVPKSLQARNSDSTCHHHELPSYHTRPLASVPNATITQQTTFKGTMLPRFHQPFDSRFQAGNQTASLASLTNKPRQRRDASIAVGSALPLLPQSYHHFPKPLLTGPLRQRSLNDLATTLAPPAVIVRPRSIPFSGTPRCINSLADPKDNRKDNLRLRNPTTAPSSYNRGININMISNYNPMNLGSNSINRSNDSSYDDSYFVHNVSHRSTEPKFIPMLSVIRTEGRGKRPTPFLSQSNRHTISPLKFSPHYHGMHTENNASMDHLAPNQNCALWLTNLPPDICVRELLSTIRNVGRVYATFINDADGHLHATAAAKLVFFTPEAAQKLLAQCLVTPLVIRGYLVKIALNRIKYAKNSMDNGESRVLIITGRADFVNTSTLTAFFQARFQFQIDDAANLMIHKGRAVVEYKFGSYRCQAQMGMKSLLLDQPAGLEMVEYGADPCEVGSEATSFTVAAARIQGRGLRLKESVACQNQ
ncbi:hypothetical protein E4U17_000062 [Claviceps sp. LM77 group G4]|nr:hypothetical protein E4U17_000062 [Claviceps sp. LM77 group G4]KAG6086658.1 hypothetical protein E4U33_002334 [Claviceps sp. LM78 group G4]